MCVIQCVPVSAGKVTSNVVADAGSEAAPPGDDAPLKQLPVDAARVYADDWFRGALRNQRRRRGLELDWTGSFISFQLVLFCFLICFFLRFPDLTITF